MEGLRGQPVDGSERRALEKKPFLAGPLQREIVEVCADFITARQTKPLQDGNALKVLGDELASVRALWYMFNLFQPRTALTPKHLDPYEEADSRSVFGFDIRSFRNVKIVFEALMLYVAEAKIPMFPDRELDAFLGAGVVTAESVKVLCSSMNEPNYYAMQRMAQLFVYLTGGDEAVERQIADNFAEIFVRSPMVAITEASIAIRRQTLLVMIRDVDQVWPKPYPSTQVRLGQGIHYSPKMLSANEIEIFLEGNTPATYHAGDTVLEENQQNWAVYHIASGSFKIYGKFNSIVEIKCF